MSKQNWHGKRILLTGATGSLGRETALALAQRGAELLLPVRNSARAEALRCELLRNCPEAQLQFLPLDMADEASVTHLAQQLCGESKPLDALIHNAGIFTKAGLYSPQCNEWHMQVNALSPLLLTKLLLPTLQLSSQPAVVTVTSLSAFWYKNSTANSDASPTCLYAQSKLHLLKELSQLSQQHPDIRFVYAHPGVCATGLFTGSTHQTAYNRHFLKIALPLMEAVFPSPEKACLPTILALLEAQNGQMAEPGGFLHIWGKPKICNLSDRLSR